MKILFEWNGHDSIEPIVCELPSVPRYEELVFLTFGSQAEHGYRVLWVRWHPQASSPYVHVFVTAR